ncbi:MAG: hypothetical protein ACLUNZ_08555 [Evtepia sp.]
MVMAVALALTAVLFLAGFAAPAFQKKYSGKAPFYTGILLFLCVLNILTAKTATLPVLYFPHWTGSSEFWWKTLRFWASACSTPCACK